MSLRDLVFSGEIRKHSAICQRQVRDLQTMMAEVGIDHLDGELGWEKRHSFEFDDSPYYDLDGYRFWFVAHKPGDRTMGYLHTRPICSSCKKAILYQKVQSAFGDAKEDALFHHVHNMVWLKDLLERFPQPGWRCEQCRDG